MRSLALFLLLLNIVFFIWQRGLLPWLPWQPSLFTEATSSHLLLSDLPKLVLLNENLEKTTNNVDIVLVEGQNVANIAPKDKSMLTKTTKEVVTNLAERKVKKETVSSFTNTENRLTAVNTENQNNVETRKNTSTLPVATLSNLQQVASLSTASEKKSVEKLQNETTYHASPPKTLPVLKDIKSTQSKKLDKTFACFQVGPYIQATTAQKIVNWLKNKKSVIVNRQSSQTKVLDSTWVYLPPFVSRQAALLAQQRLNQFGIEHYIITKGQFNNAISLGLYRQPINAKFRLKYLSTKGYKNVKTQKRYKSDTKYWLNVKIPIISQHKLLNAFRKKFKKSKFVPLACKSVANLAQIP
ncbi:hypothetical protein [Candidatus Parabeggiatoa sp. HSG14]|uniref:hypothetical protein n=1 Tax=Candidatus Parabeggiatoa sp. HSG14 TaxID=3055593 RepID=UPI0025A8E458|nr:hypothetical protein [Thiotrichales bacterium HSG14]